MMRFLAGMIVLAMPLMAFTDSDLDGVEDILDRCPATPSLELVGPDGCTLEKGVDKRREALRFDAVFGLGYSESNPDALDQDETVITSLQLDYYEGDLTLQAVLSSYRSDSDSGLNDTYLNAYYELYNEDLLSIKAGAGIILPTYDTSYGNEATDVMFSLSMMQQVGDAAWFAGYTHTMVNDRNVRSAGLYYQNTHSLSVGAGYNLRHDLYGSISYYHSDSIYRGSEAIRSLSLYLFHAVDERWFTTFMYANGLSDTASEHILSLRLGYCFR